MATPTPQYIRFRHPKPASSPDNDPAKAEIKTNTRKRPFGLFPPSLTDIRRPPFCPSFSGAFRILILIRVTAAMYRGIADCDEVFQYFDPLALLRPWTSPSQHPSPFQPWEYAPPYSLRSYFYLLFHLPPLLLTRRLSHRAQFFSVRIYLAFLSSFAEAAFYRRVVDSVGARVGRYLLIFLATATGMWEMSTSFLPSSWAAMWIEVALTVATPLPGDKPGKAQRVWIPVFAFGIASLVGWPFAALLGIPWAVELILYPNKPHGETPMGNLIQLSSAVFTSAVAILIPQIAIDSFFYQKLVIAPWNQIAYNVVNNRSHLYGTSPYYYYHLNLLLNFNLVAMLFFITPLLLRLLYKFHPKLFGQTPEARGETFRKLVFLMLPSYVWFSVLALQSHKEERFGFPAYPLLCLCSAIGLYLFRVGMERVYIKVTGKEWMATQTPLFSRITFSVLFLSAAVSLSRILALFTYYHAPMDLLLHFTTKTLPQLSLDLFPSAHASYYDPTRSIEDQDLDIVLDPLNQLNMTLCYGKEWYRFPGTLLIPEVVQTEWIKSEFAGIIPRRWIIKEDDGEHNAWSKGGDVTGRDAGGFNDLNLEELDRYVDPKTCTWLIDLDFPHRFEIFQEEVPRLDLRYATDSDNWERVFCRPFLDTKHSGRLSRTFWLPGKWWEEKNRYGDYCLLKNKMVMFKGEEK
ncbi:glycosyltransferase family 22 protein [Atractiella rhizophila]|nr:glycosyltransferase family 22 protein [Atractiella rhizophila]